MNERKYYIDIIKFVGLMCLFFAHVDGPAWLENIRSFDVPLMVIISGMLGVSSVKRSTSPMSYIWKRIKRLVIPSWMFLIVFYICMFGIGQHPKVIDIIKSFAFQRDSGLAGGVWIIWIYLICAIASPLIAQIIHDKKYWISITIAIVVSELSLCVCPNLADSRLLYYTVYSIIPYVVILSVGLIYNSLKTKNKKILIVGSACVHITFLIIYFIFIGGYQMISSYKYPAQIYYVSFGLTISLIIYELIKKNEEKMIRSKVIEFASRHSLWVYLWQIMLLTVVNYVLKIKEYWLVCWIILMTGSIFITWIQNIVIKQIEKKIKSPIWVYFKC